VLDTHFWKKYFRDYDLLNKLIPYQELLEDLNKHLDLHKSDTVLDAGSGTGNLVILLKKTTPQITAFDASREGLLIHKKKDSQAHVIEGDLLKPLPFEDNSFSKIVSNNVLYTLPRNKRDIVFKEFFRILKPQGFVVISNLQEGFKPIAIYKDHIKKSFHQKGPFSTLHELISFILPTFRIFYYNYLIRKEHKGGRYDFFESGEQKRELMNAGFVDVSDDLPTYSKQAILNKGVKP